MMKVLIPVFLTALLACRHTAEAQPELAFTPVDLTGPALSQPVDITGAGDGSARLFIVEKRGTIRIVRDGEVLDPFFLDIRSQVINNGERGLLGMAFHPQFPDTPYFYVNYVLAGSITNHISRFTVNPDNPDDALEDSQVLLLTQTGVQSNHKAGDLAFGPDGYLYIGMGDGGGANDPINAGQDGGTFLGKMLRIDVDHPAPPMTYGLPPDNPFLGTDTLPEIWATGLRNPWRYAFDRLTGDLWIADVGQNQWEEVNFIPAGTPGGMNFGWDCYEGTHDFETQNCPPGVTFTWPVFEYPHNCSPCPDGRGLSITGGFVYRGVQYPDLQGYYICADYVTNFLWLIRPDTVGGFQVQVVNGQGMVSGLVTFGEDDLGELYAANLQGVLYRVGVEGSTPVDWLDIGLTRQADRYEIAWQIEPNPDVVSFQLQRSDLPGFLSYELVGPSLPADGEIFFRADDIFLQSGRWYYRVEALLEDGTLQYSPTVSSTPDPRSGPELVVDAGRGQFSLSVPLGWEDGTLIWMDESGREMQRIQLNRMRQRTLQLPNATGIYTVRIESEKGVWENLLSW